MLVEIFKYKWPLEVYKDALHSLYNLLLQTSFSLAEIDIMPLCKFLFDIASLEFGVMRKSEGYLLDFY
jgi:hypothetical protein